jgi:hypothetical protein
MITGAAVLKSVPLLGKATQLGVDAPIDGVRWIPHVRTPPSGRYPGEDRQAVVDRGDRIEVELPRGNGLHDVFA